MGSLGCHGWADCLAGAGSVSPRRLVTHTHFAFLSLFSLCLPLVWQWGGVPGWVVGTGWGHAPSPDIPSGPGRSWQNCSPRSRTRPWSCPWTTAAPWTWMASSLRSRPSTRKSPAAAGLRPRPGTRPRCEAAEGTLSFLEGSSVSASLTPHLSPSL